MAVDFGLLNPSAPLPMQVKPFTPINPLKTESDTYTLAGNINTEKAAMEAQKSATADNETLKQAMANGQFSLSPDKIQQSVQGLQGKVSPKMFMDLSDKATKVQENATKYADSLTKLSSDKLKLYTDQTAAAVPVFDEVIKTAEMGADATGEQSAESKLPALRSAMVQKLKATGMYPDSFLAQVATMDLPALKSARDASAWQKDTVANQYRVAQTDLLKDPKKKQYFGPDGTPYFQTERGVTFKVDPTTGEPVLVPNGLPQGSTEAVPKAAAKIAKAMVGPDGAVYAQLSNTEWLKNGTERVPTSAVPAKELRPMGVPVKDKDSHILPETYEFLAEYTARTGKPPPVPSFGAGNNLGRAEYLNALARQIKDKGYTADEAGEVALLRAASGQALTAIEKQAAITQQGERTLANEGKVIKEELLKIGGPDSPLIRGLLNKGVSGVLGDPRFAGFNTAYAAYKETAAKVLSGQTGAGGTPVAYLTLAENALGKDPNLAQFYKIDETLNTLFKAREESTKETISSLLKSSKLEAKPGSVAADRGAAAAPTVPGTTTEAAAAAKASTAATPTEKDAASILKAEYNKTVTDLKNLTAKGTTGPADEVKNRKDEIVRKRNDLVAQARELKNIKVDVPTAGALFETPAAPAAAAAPAKAASAPAVVRPAGVPGDAKYSPSRKEWWLNGQKVG